MTDKNSRCHTRAQSRKAQTKQNCGMWEVPTFALLRAEEPYNFGLEIGVNTAVTKLLCSNLSQLVLSFPSLPVQVQAPVRMVRSCQASPIMSPRKCRPWSVKFVKTQTDTLISLRC